MKIKLLVKKFFSLVGLKISRIDDRRVSEANQFKWLEQFSVNTIIDVGASKGNSVLGFRRLFPKSAIYAFEPLHDCFALMQNKTRDLVNLHLYNLALSDQAGEANIFRSSYSGASSLRPMTQLHKTLFPNTAGQTLGNVKIDTLDNVLKSEVLADNILVKLDVQGYEDKVIKGGMNIMNRAKLVICETSYRPFYEGQPLFGDINRMLESLGFSYSGVWGEEFKNPTDGRPLQQDSIFIKNES